MKMTSCKIKEKETYQYNYELNDEFINFIKSQLKCRWLKMNKYKLVCILKKKTYPEHKTYCVFLRKNTLLMNALEKNTV